MLGLGGTIFKENPYRIIIFGKMEIRNQTMGLRFFGIGLEKDGGENQWYLHLFATKQPDLNWEK